MLSLRRTVLRTLVALLAGGFFFNASAVNTDEERAQVVATRFLKEYLADGFKEYFSKSPLVTAAAKAALRKLETAARKKNPELGLDHDPVVQGQDFAANYLIENVVVEGDRATAEAVAEGFPKIPLWLVRNKGGWLIDGAGEINPPPPPRR